MFSDLSTKEKRTLLKLSFTAGSNKSALLYTTNILCINS